jgi:hypothetical protein
MIRRALLSLAVLAASTSLLPLVLSGQVTTPSARTAPQAKAWTPPRTPEGQPEIQGVWNFSSLTPLERPAEFAGRPTMTLEEAATYERQVRERNNADRRDGGVEADLARAYNDVWYDRGAHVAMVNGVARTSLIVDPPDGRVPALTPDAERRQAARAQARREHPADGPEDRSLTDRCLGFNAGPPMLPGPYNNYVQLFQFKDYVVIFNEMIHDARIVPTNGRAHLPPSVRKYLGDSVGRWDGNTLVVDTTNFTDTTNFRGASENLHLVERFTRADTDTLLYEFTVNDPASFTRPWTAVLPMKQTDDLVYEYACHEGNEAMVGILRGARNEEKNPKR